MSHLVKSIGLLTFLLWVSACNNPAKEPLAVDGTSWALVQMPEELPAGVDINLQFEKDRISGKGVCNRYFSDYQLNGQQISFKAVGATEMMCLEHSDVEVKYFQALQSAEEISIQNDQLTIKTKEGDLVFKPSDVQ